MINLPTQTQNTLFTLAKIYQHYIHLNPINKEREFIKKTVDFFSFFPPISGSNFLITYRSIKTDNKFFAWLQNPRPKYKNPKKEELGDILFIVKFLKNNQFYCKTASILQAKYVKGFNTKWIIDSGQYHFMLYFPSFKLGSRNNTIHKKIFNLNPKRKTWSDYIFVNQYDKQIIHTTNRIYQAVGNRVLNQKLFTYHPNIYYSSTANFFYYLLTGRYGELIKSSSTSDIRYLIDTIYKIFGWKKDPPDEFQNLKSFEDDETGFGVVEITVNIGNND